MRRCEEPSDDGILLVIALFSLGGLLSCVAGVLELAHFGRDL